MNCGSELEVSMPKKDEIKKVTQTGNCQKVLKLECVGIGLIQNLFIQESVSITSNQGILELYNVRNF